MDRCNFQGPPPRIPRCSCAPPDLSLYTDEALSTSRITALLVEGGPRQPAVLLLTSSRVPLFGPKDFNPKNIIFSREILDPLAFIWANRKLLPKRSSNLYIANNNNAPAFLVKGDSIADFVAAMIACFWRISEAYSIDIWLGRVRSNLNSSDVPKRNPPAPSGWISEPGLVLFFSYFRWRLNG